MIKQSLIAHAIVEALHVLPKEDQDYVLNFGKALEKSFTVIKRFFRNEFYLGKTADGYDTYVHIKGNLYIMYSEMVYEGKQIYLIFNVFKKELKSIKPDPGDVSEKIISKISH